MLELSRLLPDTTTICISSGGGGGGGGGGAAPAIPATPATPATPAVPATPATPAVPANVIAGCGNRTTGLASLLEHLA